MRTLKFNVNGQTITHDPDCNFTDLYPGTKDYICAEFSFSPEWETAQKVAAFWSIMGYEYPPQPLKDGRTCMIPAEALQKAAFKVQILGRINGAVVPTNKVRVDQKGGRA